MGESQDKNKEHFKLLRSLIDFINPKQKDGRITVDDGL